MKSRVPFVALMIVGLALIGRQRPVASDSPSFIEQQFPYITNRSRLERVTFNAGVTYGLRCLTNVIHNQGQVTNGFDFCAIAWTQWTNDVVKGHL